MPPFIMPGNSFLLSVSMNLTTLGTSYKWCLHVSICLPVTTFFTWYNILKVYPGGSMYQNFLLC